MKKITMYSEQTGQNRRFIRLNIQENMPLILAFLLPVLVLITGFAGNGIFPFGDNSFLRVDLYHQYAPFLSAMKQKMSGGDSFSYTWTVGLGSNFLSLYGYYLASPFNWLLFLCPLDYVIEFLSYMVVFKTGLTGLFFALYLSRKSGRKDYFATFFSVFFALSGYFAAYNWNIMWTDCIMLTPLVFLGLELLVNEQQNRLYCVSLALCILSNYYISIMICMFCVLYFIVLIVSLPVPKKKTAGDEGENRNSFYVRICANFFFCSLLAGGLASCLIVPEIMALRLTASGEINFPKEWKSYFSIFDMLIRHMALTETEIGLEHWPNIYCGTAALTALPIYLINRELPWKEKTAKMALILFMLFSFSTNIPNYIWHGFHFPNSLPCRQSFLYIALLLSMCYDGVRDLKKHNPGQITGAFAGTAVFILLAQKLADSEKYPFYIFYTALILTGLYMIAARLYQEDKITGSAAVVLMLCLAVVETTANTACTSITTTSRSAYLEHTGEFRQLTARTQEEDKDFYRFEKVSLRSKNDGAWIGYPSASIFSSTANASLTDFYVALGMEGSMNAYAVTGMTPLIRSILNIRYILSSGPLDEREGVSVCSENQGAYIYQNQYPLPVGFMVPRDMNDQWKPQNSNPVAAQNLFSLYAAGTGELLEPVANIRTSGSTFEIYPEKPGHLFVQIENREIRDVNAVIGERTKNWSHTDRGFLLDLGFCSPEETIRLTCEQDTSFTASAWLFRYDRLNALREILSQQPLEITSWSDSSLDGVIDVQEDGLLFTSVPYDNGWILTVDGEERQIQVFAKSMISVFLTAGSHRIRLEYRAPGQNLGLLLSASSLIAACLILMGRRLLQAREGKEKRKTILKKINSGGTKL